MKDASEESKQLREGIRVAYRQGEEAVIALVERMLKGQAEAIVQLESRIEVLENQASKDSKNSSKPPSRDGFKKRTQSLQSKSERKSGGQPGHPGSTLEWVEEADTIEVSYSLLGLFTLFITPAILNKTFQKPKYRTKGLELGQTHKTGLIWKYTDTPCSGDSCPGWQKLDNNPATLKISSGTTSLP